MKKNVLFAILITITISTLAQDANYKIPLSTNASIIREYQENVYIVYSSDGVSSTVNYVDLNSLVTVTAQLPLVDISDFEIYNGTVYYCGSAYGMPVAGLFDIIGVFFGGIAINYIPLTNIIPCNHYPTETDAILSLRKLEVMPVDGVSPHILMVGDASCSKLPGCVNRCIVELYFDGFNWVSAVSEAHDGIMYYDDLTVTDNYVVCVAHKHEAEGEYVVPFDRLNLIFGNNIFEQAENMASPYIGPFIFPVNYHISGGVWSYYPATDEGFLIEHLTGDNFATICHGYSNEYYNRIGTVLNIYNSLFNVVGRYMISEISTEYPELKFNNITASLYLLPGGSSSCPNSYLEYLVDVSTLSLLSVNKYTDNILTGSSLLSLDAAPLSFLAGLGQSCLSGNFGNLLHVWRHWVSGMSGCTSRIELSFEKINTLKGFSNLTYEYGVANQLPLSFIPTIILNSIDVECSEVKK